MNMYSLRSLCISFSFIIGILSLSGCVEESTTSPSFNPFEQALGYSKYLPDSSSVTSDAVIVERRYYTRVDTLYEATVSAAFSSGGNAAMPAAVRINNTALQVSNTSSVYSKHFYNSWQEQPAAHIEIQGYEGKDVTIDHYSLPPLQITSYKDQDTIDGTKELVLSYMDTLNYLSSVQDSDQIKAVIIVKNVVNDLVNRTITMHAKGKIVLPEKMIQAINPGKEIEVRILRWQFKETTHDAKKVGYYNEAWQSITLHVRE